MTSLIDSHCMKLIKYSSVKTNSSFQELITQVKNTATLTNRLNLLIQLKILQHEGRKYRLTEKGKIISEHLQKINRLVKGDDDIYDDPFNRIPNVLIIELLRDYVSILKNHFGKKLLSVILFGSCARGDWNQESDIDLLIINKNWQIPSWEKTRILIKLKKDLSKKTSYKILQTMNRHHNISHYPLSDKDFSSLHPIMYDIVVDGIILQETTNFGRNLIKEYRDQLIRNNAVMIVQPTKERFWLIGKKIKF